MSRLLALTLVAVSGCFGDAALPIVSSTRIPETQLSVHLGGPDTKGGIGYYVTSSSGIHYGYRPLGRLKPNQTKPATLQSLGNGVFRIQWGEPPTAQYAIIDTKNKRFVKDSNQENAKNQPFVEH
jgi:hypothetical protein